MFARPEVDLRDGIAAETIGDVHGAVPLPDPGPGSGSAPDWESTGAPAARATAAVASVEPSSSTTISSTRPSPSGEPGSTRRFRTSHTMLPIVAASLRAGRHT